MLDELQIDYLGVSIDALLIIAPADDAEEIAKIIRRAGVAVDEIGSVEAGEGAELHIDDKTTDFSPRFREAAYTPIKKTVGQDAHRDVTEMTRLVNNAAKSAVEKKRRFIEKIKRN
jgi:hydrogenase expression/formation protein